MLPAYGAMARTEIERHGGTSRSSSAMPSSAFSASQSPMRTTPFAPCVPAWTCVDAAT